MRSVEVYLRDTSVDEVVRFLDRACPRQASPWIWEAHGDACLYVDPSGVDFRGDQEREDVVVAALGCAPAVWVGVEVSGQHRGDEEVRAFLSELLRAFQGVAQDEYTLHAWTLEELLSGHRVEGHPFFDYQGWFDERAR